jgi:hypothetical protein
MSESVANMRPLLAVLVLVRPLLTEARRAIEQNYCLIESTMYYYSVSHIPQGKPTRHLRWSQYQRAPSTNEPDPGSNNMQDADQEKQKNRTLPTAKRRTLHRT